MGIIGHNPLSDSFACASERRADMGVKNSHPKTVEWGGQVWERGRETFSSQAEDSGRLKGIAGEPVMLLEARKCECRYW